MDCSRVPASSPARSQSGSPSSPKRRPDLRDWGSVRSQFALDRSRIHLTSFLLATHPRLVRDAIAAHRTRLDANPVEYLHGAGRRSERCGARRRRSLPGRAGVRGRAHRLDDDGTRAPLHAARARPGRRGRDDRARLLRHARVAPALRRARPAHTALRRREARLGGRDREPCRACRLGPDASRRSHVGPLGHGSPAAGAVDRAGAARAGARVRRRRARLRRSRRDRAGPRLRRVRLRLPQVALRAARDGRAVGERRGCAS